MAKGKIFIVEDEKDIAEMVKYNLEKEGYGVKILEDGESAIASAKKDKPDLILLDLMLPGIDGFEVCRILKAKDLTAAIPIIMLTAKSQETDKVAGLELGADDYVTKPFSPRELLARIKVVLRRGKRMTVDNVTSRGKITIDSVKHRIFIEQKEIFLTHTEFKLLEFMFKRPDMVLSREKLLDGVFGYDSEIYDRTVDAHIKSLRKKLGKARECIETVRGMGYRLRDEK